MRFCRNLSTFAIKRVAYAHTFLTKDFLLTRLLDDPDFARNRPLPVGPPFTPHFSSATDWRQSSALIALS